jgi:hypothetical protein
VHLRAIRSPIHADSPERGQDGRRIRVQDNGYGVALTGFAEAISPRSVRGTRLEERDHRVLPVAALDDVEALGWSLRHISIIPEEYDNPPLSEFAEDVQITRSKLASGSIAAPGLGRPHRG